MRLVVRCLVVAVAALALFTIPAVAWPVEPAPSGPRVTPSPSPYGYPPEVRR